MSDPVCPVCGGSMFRQSMPGLDYWQCRRAFLDATHRVPQPPPVPVGEVVEEPVAP